MARRRRHTTRYYRANPLSDTELIVGGLVGLAVIGVGGYAIYNYYQGHAANAAALANGTASPGGVVSQGVNAQGVQTVNGYEVG